jgi:hypothetical protein
MDEHESRFSQVMLAVCLVDMSPGLGDAIRGFYQTLPPPLRSDFLHLLARAEAESVQFTEGTADRMMAEQRN